MKDSTTPNARSRAWLARRRPPVPVLVVILALVVAASGTAVAAQTNAVPIAKVKSSKATSRIRGDTLIMKHSLSGNRLRNGTITGKQVNLNRLGKVPSATSADTAQTAANAEALGGQPASAYEPASNFVHTGLVKAAPGQTVPLTSFGPFTLTLKCTSPDPGNVESEIDAKSSEANSYGAYTQLTDPAQTYDVWDADESDTADEFDGTAHFVSPSGKAYAADLLAGENDLGLAQTCFADVSASPS